MPLTRRDLFKMGLLVSGAAVLPLERSVTAGTSTIGNRIAASGLPRLFTVPFAKPPLARPLRTSATTDYYRIVSRPFGAEILPGLKTPLFGYEGSVPGPTILVGRNRRTVVRHVNLLPRSHPV